MKKVFNISLIFLIGSISSCYKSNAQNSQNYSEQSVYYLVKARANADSETWNTYTAKTINRIRRLQDFSGLRKKVIDGGLSIRKVIRLSTKG